MRFMVMVKATKDSEAGVMPSTELLSEMGKFNEELVKAGVMLAGEGLHPSSNGARAKFNCATIEHGQRARQAQTDGTGVRVGLVAEARRAAAKDF